ncbi:hypothetical protein TorRG33x02_201130 [Trema orientale]|uniref:Transmembrane protein n=1 Tax=Trema orientale TaxID=63057 RepID=A0A2P5EEY5_TREOI|nr:hypothetical protein TorRG33x02_201130 [Trema orientale]
MPEGGETCCSLISEAGAVGGTLEAWMKLVKQRNAMRANLKPHLKAAMFEVVVFFFSLLKLLLLLLHGLVKDMSFLYTHYTQYKLAECVFIFFFFGFSHHVKSESCSLCSSGF